MYLKGIKEVFVAYKYCKDTYKETEFVSHVQVVQNDLTTSYKVINNSGPQGWKIKTGDVMSRRRSTETVKLVELICSIKEPNYCFTTIPFGPFHRTTLIDENSIRLAAICDQNSLKRVSLLEEDICISIIEVLKQ